MRGVAAALAVVLLALTPISSAAAACDPAGGSGCDLRSRIATAQQYLAIRPGSTGFVIRDRATGFRFANAGASDMTWTASTIKLAMVVDLVSRDRVGAIRLTAGDRQAMATMLRTSDNAAADLLWSRYGGAAFNDNAPRYGMVDLRPQPGFGDVFPYWGFQKSTADDFDRLINHALTRLVPADAAAIAAEMQGVDGNQKWGVWGAGAGMAPGLKNGWSAEQGGWVVNSVGFAGPDRRYTLAIMNSLEGEGEFAEGAETTTTLARILLGSATP